MIRVPLVEDHEYMFRVSAENRCGFSEPLLMSNHVIARDPAQVC